jgi:aldehyde dehydrogenase (NAD+)
VIKELAAKSNLKNVTIELGGKSPCIVFEDADLSAAVAAAAFSIAQNSGQVCMATSRVYVHESIADEFTKTYLTEFKRHMGTPGDTLAASTTHAPQADASQFKSVMGFIENAKAKGIEPVLGGSQIGQKGYFIEPTVFFNPGENSTINREEVFGPVSVINTFKNEDEALRLANDSEYGLYSSVFTKDLQRAIRFAKFLESGMVGVNCMSPTLPWDLPFGGWKQSGEGSEFSLKSLYAWTETKSVLIKA